MIFTNVFKVINSPGYNFPPKDSVFFGKIDFRSFCCQWYFRVKIRNNVGPLKSASVCIHSFNYACVKGRKTLFKPINSSCLVPSSFKPIGKKIHRKVLRIFWIEVMVKVMVLELYMGFVETFLWINFKVSSRKEENVTLSKIGLILRQNNHKEMKIFKIIFFHTSSTIVLRLNIGHVKTNLLQRQISQFAINTFISDQHNPQFLQSLRRRANARNVSFFLPFTVANLRFQLSC